MSDNKEIKNTDVVEEAQDVQEADKVDDFKKELNRRYNESTIDAMPTTDGVASVLADNPNYEGASNQTTNFKLPLYVRGDNFKVLTDQNIAMSIIDDTLAALNDKGTGNDRRITQLNRDLSLLRNSLNALQGIVTNQGNHLNDIDEDINMIPGIQADLISQNNLIKALTTRVLALEDGQTSAEGNIGTLRSEVSTLKTSVESNDSEIAQLFRKIKAGYAFKNEIGLGNTTLTTRVYGGNPIERSKYLVTISGSRTDSSGQTGYSKQWVIDGDNIKSDNVSHLTLVSGSTSSLVATGLYTTIAITKDGTYINVNANVSVSSGTWALIMTAIPVY